MQAFRTNGRCFGSFSDCNYQYGKDAYGQDITLGDEIPGTFREGNNDRRGYIYLAKFTFNLNNRHRLELSVNGQSSARTSPNLTAPNIYYDFSVINGGDMQLRLSHKANFFNQTLLFDSSVAWFTSWGRRYTDDGSSHLTPTSQPRAASTPRIYEAPGAGANEPGSSPYNNIFRYTNGSEPYLALCRPFGALPQGFNPDTQRLGTINPCPGSNSRRFQYGGGSGGSQSTSGRFQLVSTVSYLLQAWGHHQLKAGLDLEIAYYNNLGWWAGGSYGYFGEVVDGTSSGADYGWNYAYLSGYNEVRTPQYRSVQVGNRFYAFFVQDSWEIFDLVTLNAGLRYTTQQHRRCGPHRRVEQQQHARSPAGAGLRLCPALYPPRALQARRQLQPLLPAGAPEHRQPVPHRRIPTCSPGYPVRT